MKLLRAIRLDPSDGFVFNRAAEPGEWAVAGSFMFAGRDVAALEGKARAAFRSGFVGVESLGFTTLCVATPARPDEVEAATAMLARWFLTHFGAPDEAEARRAAEDEIAYSAELAAHEEGTLIALHRLFEDGEIRETFRTLRRKGAGAGGADALHSGARAFEIRAVDEEEGGVEERVDLVTLMGEPKP